MTNAIVDSLSRADIVCRSSSPLLPDADNDVVHRYYMTLLLPDNYTIDERIGAAAGVLITQRPPSLDHLLMVVGMIVESFSKKHVTHSLVLERLFSDERIVKALFDVNVLNDSITAMLSKHSSIHYEMDNSFFYRAARPTGASPHDVLVAKPYDVLCTAATRVLVKECAFNERSAMAFQSFTVALIERLECVRTERTFFLSSLQYKLSHSSAFVLTEVEHSTNGRSEHTWLTIHLK